MITEKPWAEIALANGHTLDLGHVMVRMNSPAVVPDTRFDTVILRRIEPPTVEIVFLKEPLKRVVVWPQDIFVEYERSDELWAIPLRFARERPERLRPGDVTWLGDYHPGCDGRMVLTEISVEGRRGQPEFVAKFQCLETPGDFAIATA